MADKKYHQFPAGSPSTTQILLIANPTTGALTKITIQQLIDLVGSGALVAPSITSQPVGTTISQGQTLSLSVSATGTAPLSYQWRRGGVNLSGQTNATLNMPNAQPVDTGNYDVVITNSAGVITSNSVSVTVNASTATYTHVLNFTNSTSAAVAGVNGTVGATNATIKFEFNGIANLTGTPVSMSIYVSGVIKMVIDYTTDYGGQAFRFTDTTGATYTSTFLSVTGNKNL